MSQVEVAFVIFDLFEIWRRSSRSPPPHNILTPEDFFQGAQTIVNSLISHYNNIWSRPSRSPPPHNILTSIFQRTETNTVETIVNAKRLKSTLQKPAVPQK